MEEIYKGQSKCCFKQEQSQADVPKPCHWNCNTRVQKVMFLNTLKYEFRQANAPHNYERKALSLNNINGKLLLK